MGIELLPGRHPAGLGMIWSHIKYRIRGGGGVQGYLGYQVWVGMPLRCSLINSPWCQTVLKAFLTSSIATYAFLLLSLIDWMASCRTKAVWVGTHSDMSKGKQDQSNFATTKCAIFLQLHKTTVQQHSLGIASFPGFQAWE